MTKQEGERKAKANDMTMLPCGCVYWTEGMLFFLDPCKDPDCKNRKWIYEETARQGHPTMEKSI